MQQELPNQATTARQEHHKTLQQTLPTAQHINELAQHLPTTQQAGSVEIQSTFHQAFDPKLHNLKWHLNGVQKLECQ